MPLLLPASATKSSTSIRCAASKLLLRNHPRDAPASACAASGSTGVASPAVAATGQPGDRSRPPDPAEATNANHGPPEPDVTANLTDNDPAATATAATRSPHADPAEVGILTSTPAATAFCRKTVRAASSRPAARRSQPRTVDTGTGTDKHAPIRRCPTPSARACNAAHTSSQGRDIQPSRQVLSALARPLGLSAAEHAYVLSLVGYSPRATSPEPQTPDAPGDVQRLLDSLHGSPAFAITRNWSIVGWNAAYSALYPNIAAATPPDRNLLWLVFTDPFVRQLLPDWDLDSRRFLAEFRTEVGPDLGESAVTAVVDRLHATSEAFRAGWSRHDIEGFSSRERVFQHPLGKGLRLERHRLTPADHPELHVVIYSPVDDGHTPAALRGGDPWR